MCWAAERCKSQCGRGSVQSGTLGRATARRGKVRSVLARQGLQTAAQGASASSAALSGAVLVVPGGARRGGAGLGMAWRGGLSSGLARATDGGTEGLRAFPAILTDGFCRAWRDAVAYGAPGQGAVRQGSARAATAARRASALPAAFTGGSGLTRRGWEWQGKAGCDAVSRCWAWAADGSTELLRRLPAVLIESSRGAAWSGTVWPGNARRGLSGRGKEAA
jgi:hypothetical protein